MSIFLKNSIVTVIEYLFLLNFSVIQKSILAKLQLLEAQFDVKIYFLAYKTFTFN